MKGRVTMFYDPPNRLAKFFPVEAPAPKTTLAKLLDAAGEIKLRLIRFEEDDGTIEQYVSYEVHGDLEADAGTLAAMLAQFKPRNDGGAA
jgi:hypothetical protein